MDKLSGSHCPVAAGPRWPLATADRSGRRVAFTLVEMLVVMAVIILMLSAAVPVLRGILGSRGITNSVDAISAFLTSARIQAMSQNTYVVVGFYQAQGSDDLQMQAVRSLGGTLDTSNFTAAKLASGALTYRPLGPIIHLPNVTLTPYANLTSTLRSKLTDASAAPNPTTQTSDASKIIVPDTPANPTASGSSGGLEFMFGTTTFNWYVIAFTPQGEALYFPTAPTSTTGASTVSTNTPYYSELFIGVNTSRGGAALPNDNTAEAITIDGGSGSVNVYSL